MRGLELEAAEVDRQIELYRTRDAEQRRSIRGLQPKRAEVILAGACIVRIVLAKLGRDSLMVSDQGLRHGVLLERFSALNADPQAAVGTVDVDADQPPARAADADRRPASSRAANAPACPRARASRARVARREADSHLPAAQKAAWR